MPNTPTLLVIAFTLAALFIACGIWGGDIAIR